MRAAPRMSLSVAGPRSGAIRSTPPPSCQILSPRKPETKRPGKMPPGPLNRSAWSRTSKHRLRPRPPVQGVHFIRRLRTVHVPSEKILVEQLSILSLVSPMRPWAGRFLYVTREALFAQQGNPRFPRNFSRARVRTPPRDPSEFDSFPSTPHARPPRGGGGEFPATDLAEAAKSSPLPLKESSPRRPRRFAPLHGLPGDLPFPCGRAEHPVPKSGTPGYEVAICPEPPNAKRPGEIPPRPDSLARSSPEGQTGRMERSPRE